MGAASVDESAGAAILRSVGLAPSEHDIAGHLPWRSFKVVLERAEGFRDQMGIKTPSSQSGTARDSWESTDVAGDTCLAGGPISGGVALTVKVVGSFHMRPVNALVSLNGIWFQQENGSATILSTGRTQEIIVEAEYLACTLESGRSPRTLSLPYVTDPD
jgi:hypothetical protein